MKFKIIIIFILNFVLMGTAHASGCLGPYWDLVEQNSTPMTLTSSQWALRLTSASNWSGQGHLVFESAETPKISFVATINVATAPLAEIFTKLPALGKEITVTLQEHVSISVGYDDCQDLPEGTKSIERRYILQVPLSDGSKLRMDAYLSYQTVLPDGTVL